VYGALVPASRFVPPNGTEAKAKSLGRANAAKFLERLCKYPGTPQAIAEAEEHILAAHAERLTAETGKPVSVDDIRAGHAPRPKVLDMFAGGGAIPLEALRLGCEAYALDLNPVAHIIELCTLVYPQKYGKPDASAKGSAKDGTWAGLAAEVKHWGGWVLEKVRTEIGDLYPLIPDPKHRGKRPPAQADLWVRTKSDVLPGYLVPVAYLWTRTVRCKNASCSATVPLVKQTWLCKKQKRYVALKIVAPKKTQEVRFEVVESGSERGLGFDPEAGSKGGNATCPFCGTVADSDYVQAEGVARKTGFQLMATACLRPGAQGKVYLAADDVSDGDPDEREIARRLDALCTRSSLTVPNESISAARPSPNARGLTAVTRHGLTRFADLFMPRQILALMSFAASSRAAASEMKRTGYDEEHATAVGTCLGLLVDRLADFNSTGCTWNYTGGRGVIHTMARPALPMVWDCAETNPFNPEAASWISAIDDLPSSFGSMQTALAGNVARGSATTLPWGAEEFDAVVTDPPYYDNVPYADMSDFFYVWLKRTAGELHPEHFASDLTPKKAEATALSSRHDGDMAKANSTYESMMLDSFREASRVLRRGGPLVVVYAHKSTLGWATLLDALRAAGFTVTEAWPLDTERPGRVQSQDTASLASSIFLVARKRDGDATGSYEDEVRQDLEQIVRERVETLWDLGIAGADLVIAAVGAGLRAFTRFARVEYANGEEVPAARFLAEVEGVVLETLLEKIFGVPRSGVAAVDGPSRFYVLWRYTYKAAELKAGEAIVFTYGQRVELDGAKGLSSGSRPLVEKKKGKYRLLDFTERGDDEKLGLPAEDGTPAPLVDVLHRTLWLLENEPRKVARFLDEARPDRERLRLCAQALAGAGLKGKADGEAKALVATTASEQAALAKLTANWRAIIEQRLGEYDAKGQKRMAFEKGGTGT
jgi:putative DNA methylase